MIEEDVDDYSDVQLIVAMLIGTSANHTIDHATRIQKMAFLIDKIIAQSELDEEFDFQPHHFGPMSEAVQTSVGELINWGFAEIAGGYGKGATLTRSGIDLIEAASRRYPGIYRLCKELNESMNNINDGELIKIVYRLYPEDTVNSLIKDEMVETKRVDSFEVDLNVNGTYNIISENGVLVHVIVNQGIVSLDLDGYYVRY